MKNKILLIILLILGPLTIFLALKKIRQNSISLMEPNGENITQVQGAKTEFIFDEDLKPTITLEASNNNTNQPTEGNNVQQTDKTKLALPPMMIEQNKTYTAIITTNRGEIQLALDAKNAPITVNNFVALSKMGFYNNTIFHRVIEGFMIQGGDPLGNGTGGPNYTFEDEQSPNKLVQGSLAMANRGPNTNGSQFFIVTAEATPWLDGKHTNFGKVTKGLEVVMAIDKVQTDGQDKPSVDVVIQNIEIVEK